MCEPKWFRDDRKLFSHSHTLYPVGGRQSCWVERRQKAVQSFSFCTYYVGGRETQSCYRIVMDSIIQGQAHTGLHLRISILRFRLEPKGCIFSPHQPIYTCLHMYIWSLKGIRPHTEGRDPSKGYIMPEIILLSGFVCVSR